jgi:hypothetical protein
MNTPIQLKKNSKLTGTVLELHIVDILAGSSYGSSSRDCRVNKDSKQCHADPIKAHSRNNLFHIREPHIYGYADAALSLTQLLPLPYGRVITSR